MSVSSNKKFLSSVLALMGYKLIALRGNIAVGYNVYSNDYAFWYFKHGFRPHKFDSCTSRVDAVFKFSVLMKG